MKFADHLTESAIPEWKDKYIDYRLGKKKLKYNYSKFPHDPRIKRNTSISNSNSNSVESFASLSSASFLSQQRQNGYGYRSNVSLNTFNPSLSTANGASQQPAPFTSSYLENNQYTPLQKYAIKDFIENWLIGEELVKCNDFYQWLLNECKKKFIILQSQISIYNYQRKYKQNGLDTHSLISRNNINKNGPSNSYTSLPNLDSADLELSEAVIDDAMDAISFNNPNTTLYGTLSPTMSANEEYLTLGTKIKLFLKNTNLLPSWPKNAHLKRNRQRIDDSLFFDPAKETFAYDPLNISTDITLYQAQRLLSDAILEYYLFLQLVKTFRDLNVTGFRKMMKKFDKTLQTKEINKFMKYAKENYSLFKHVNASVQLIAQKMQQNTSNQPATDLVPNNPKDDPLLWWEMKSKSWFTKDLTNSPNDIKKNNKTLKKMIVQYTLNEQMIHRNNRSIIQMTTAGMFIGASIALFVYTLHMSFISQPLSYTHKILFPLWGGWYMALLMLVLFQVNCFIWHRTGINYRFIMLGETKSRNGTQLFNNDFATSGIPLKIYFVSFFVIIGAICGASSFKYQHLSPWAFISMGLTLLLFFLPPGFIPYWDKIAHTRNWLLVRTIRLILSGIYPVEFGDFFLGDIICSLTYSMSDIAMFACIYTTHEQGLCGSSHSKSMGVLSCLPSFWRFMQCLRRFADSGDWFPHLINAWKYSLGVAYNAALCAYRLSNGKESYRTPFIIIATANSTLTSLWDIVIDWSLFQPSERNLFLRDDLYLAGKRNWEDGSYDPSKKTLYYIAMVWDVVIRFQWIVYAVAPTTIQQSAVTSFILALTELLRRFVWVIFRVENEHVANVHLFKVSGDAPLPYPIVHDINMDIALENRGTNYPIPQSSSNTSIPQLENVFDEPSAAYHTMIRRRASLFDNLSKSIPWAHATDFQRPLVVPSSGIDEGRMESDTESENGV